MADGELDLIRPDWPAPPQVRAAMTTRRGGVSRGPWASLNLGTGCGDDATAVTENRRRLRHALQLPVEPGWLRQVHGTRVVDLAAAPALPEADASFATRPGLICVAQAADCLPVLFCDDAGTVVAAAHAGWRGLAAGVLEATVRALPVPAATLMAWLGPAIGPTAFEVGLEVRAAFVDHDFGAADCFTSTPASGKLLANLQALARRRLARVGVARIYGGDHCTYTGTDTFFSHRRDRTCGRMAALVWIAAGPSEIVRNEPSEMVRNG